MTYRRPVELRLATREELEARGYDAKVVERILAKQAKAYDQAPGTVLETYEQDTIAKPSWREFSLT